MTLEAACRPRYDRRMTNVKDDAPLGWLDVLAESEADLAAGQIIPGDLIIRDLQGGLERLKAKAAAEAIHEVTQQP